MSAKFIVPLIFLIVAILQYALEYLWSDRRTRRNKRLRVSRLMFLVAGAIVSLLVVKEEERGSALQRSQLEELLKVTRSAERTAMVRADVAEQARSRLESQHEELQSQLEPFLETAKQRYPAETTEGALSQLAEELAQVKSTVEEVEKAQKPRTLDAMAEKRLVAILSQGPTGSINVLLPIVVGAEAQAILAQLEKSLVAAGWVIQNRAIIPFSNSATGMFVQVKSSQTAPARARYLLKALTEVGIEVRGIENSKAKPDQVDLIVARKGQ